jgi:hypothetical protein
MLSICLCVFQIIETIDTARYQAKRHEYEKRRYEIIHLQQMITEENRRKDKRILEPLQGAE